MIKVEEKQLGVLKPYANNPRNNKDAVDKVAASIKEFGFKVPIVITADNVIISGHTRYLASKKLGLKTVPCVIADDLTPAQAKTFRLVDNKVGEYATWDLSKLDAELADIDVDMTEFGFNNVDFISDLMNGGFDTKDFGEKEGQKEFAVTFIFPIECQKKMLAYIKNKTKEPLVKMITEEVEKDA